MEHEVTQQFRSVLTRRAEEKGLADHPKFSTLLEEKAGQLNDWMDQKPDFVKSMSVLGEEDRKN